jgi:hypothetical protein
MILDDIQSHKIDDSLIASYVWQSFYLFYLILFGGIFVFSGGEFEIISNNMKTMSNIMILIYC